MNLSYLPTSAPISAALNETLTTEKPFLIAFPVIVVSICIVIGLTGNSLVLYVYKSKRNESTYRIFILCLALFDCVECGIGMPFMIANQFSVSSTAACKGFTFVLYFVSIGSGMMLVVIAYERYRRVCKPSCRQISPTTGKLLAIVITAISMSLSWPALLFYEYDTFVLDNFSEGSCHIYTELLSGSIYPVIYYAILAMTWLTGYNIVTACYVMIWRQMKTHYDARSRTLSVKMTKKSETGHHNSEDSYVSTKYGPKWDIEINVIQETYEDSDNRQVSGAKASRNKPKLIPWKVSERQQFSEQTKCSLKHSEEKSTETFKERCLQLTPKLVQKSHDSHFQNLTVGDSSKDLNKTISKDFLRPEKEHTPSSRQSDSDRLKKITRIMFVIALVNMVSYIPHIALSIVTFAYPDRVYTETEQVIYFQILSRSFMINSFVNPFIYGVMDQSFRLQCRKLKSRWQQRIKSIQLPFMSNV